MSYKIITDTVIDNLIYHFKKKENIQKLKQNILEPIIVDIISQLYPYIILFVLSIILLFLLIVSILFLNIRICYKK